MNVRFLRTQKGSAAAIGAVGDVLSYVQIVPDTQELALFGETNYHLTERLTLTAGLRWFRNEADFSSSRSGYLSGRQTPPRSSSESHTTPRVAALYRFNEGLSAYVQASQGYRVGQNNFSLIDDPRSGFVPPAYFESDSLWNYEVGLKSVADGGRLRMNLAVYYIDWKDIQFTIGGSTGTYTDNAGDATSKGVELDVQFSPTSWFSFGIAAAYTDAELVSVAAGVTDAKPGPLPGSTDWATRTYAQLTSDRWIPAATAYVRLSHQYTGEKQATIGSGGFDPVGLTTDAYQKVDIRTGAILGNMDVALYVDNLTNDDASLAPRRIPFTADASTRLRPRTVGVNLRYEF